MDQGKALDVCVYPLAKAFINIKGNLKTEQEKEVLHKQIWIFDELLEDYSDYDIEVLSLTLIYLKSTIKSVSKRNLYKYIKKYNRKH